MFSASMFVARGNSIKGMSASPVKCLLQEGDALCSMYEQDAMMSTEDGNIFIWAGATVGGGTRVNWYARFATYIMEHACVM